MDEKIKVPFEASKIRNEKCNFPPAAHLNEIVKNAMIKK